MRGGDHDPDSLTIQHGRSETSDDADAEKYRGEQGGRHAEASGAVGVHPAWLGRVVAREAEERGEGCEGHSTPDRI